jgi:4-amino-4-deoxy-L-arabinose transferase-like glycosyltransferase
VVAPELAQQNYSESAASHDDDDVAVGGSQTSAGPRWERIAVLCLVIGSALRVVWVLIIHPPVNYLYSDMAAYVDRAQRLASGGPTGRFDAFYPPGTHILLAIPMKVLGPHSAGLWAAAVLWCALSIAIPWLSWLLARELLTPAAAAIAAALCAFWPIFITYGGVFTSETPSLAFMVAALWLAVLATRATGRSAIMLALVAGLLGGFAIAMRPQLLMNMAIVAAVLLIKFRRRIVPLASFGLGVAFVLALVVTYNSVAAQRLTGISENSGLNFWMGHCDVHDVTTVDRSQGVDAYFLSPVALQLQRGGSYRFEDRMVWDQVFFYGLGWDCIRRDGGRHAFLLSRNVIDMTATTTPWPQVSNERGERDIVIVANVIYALLLPWIVIESLFLIRRRRKEGLPAGEAILLAHLACAVPVALLIFGDPRLRSVYDVFGLILLAALLADRFNLGKSASTEAT